MSRSRVRGGGGGGGAGGGGGGGGAAAFIAALLCGLLLPAGAADATYKTLSGNEPLVIAKGGFSGVFPDSSHNAFAFALMASAPDTTLWCDVQLTKDGIGICLRDIDMKNCTDIDQAYPARKSRYVIDGVHKTGWFSVDFNMSEFQTVLLTQAIWSRTEKFDAEYSIVSVTDLQSIVKRPSTWLNVQHDIFYRQHGLDMRSYILSIQKRFSVKYISSPELGFLQSISGRVSGKTKLVFCFLDKTQSEPSTNQTYGSLLSNLTFIKTTASGIMVPKSYIWPVTNDNYLLPPTSIVRDAHNVGLEIYASDFANDNIIPYNYSYDPLQEYLSFISDGDFSVDGVLTDYPITASEAVGCFVKLNARKADHGKPLIISHNGASGDYPDCTDLAYHNAIKDGADVIDCTVQVTSDGVLICMSSNNLLDTTNVQMTSFSSLASVIPEIKGTPGIFTFNLTWDNISDSALRPKISIPFSIYNDVVRNPRYANQGKFLKFSDFLAYGKDKDLFGVMVIIKNAAFMAKSLGFDVIESVTTALNDAGYNNQTSKEVMIQSKDRAVLAKFKQQKTNYKLVYTLPLNIEDASASSVVDVKEFADAVVVDKNSVFGQSRYFIIRQTNLVRDLQSAGLAVYAELFRNEFLSQPWDFFADETVEINSYVQSVIVDGLITDFPKTVRRYKRNSCTGLGNDMPSYMRTVEVGDLAQLLIRESSASSVEQPPIPPVAPKNAPPGPPGAATGSSNCTTQCGNISIPYPFGVEPGCYLDGFDLTCRNASHGHKKLLFLGDGTVQVLEINLSDATVLINNRRVDFQLGDDGDDDDANNRWVEWTAGGLRYDDRPYFLQKMRNNLLVLGCNVQVLVQGEDHNLVSTCAPLCPVTIDADGTHLLTSPYSCSGLGCCQAAIPVSHASYRLQLQPLDMEYNDYVYIVDSEYNHIPSNEDSQSHAPATLPAVLGWTINSSPCHSNGSSPSCRSSHSFCQNNTDVYPYLSDGHNCRCSHGYQGNPYISNGCSDINECDSPNIYPCYGDCKNTQGGYSCQCSPGYTGSPYTQNGCKDIDECAHPEAYSCYGDCKNTPGTFHCHCRDGTNGDPTKKGGCVTFKSSFTGLSIGLAVSGGSIILLMALAAPFITHKINLHRVNKLKGRLFKQNHGLLLQQLISQKTDFGERMIIPLRDLEKATNNFDRTREAGGGGHGVVYKGILDLQVVAIKKSKIVVQREIDDFINEVAILSQINHRNVVKLIGCCLETEVPLLVYEFISNGTLDHHLHVEGLMSLSWDDRIRISLEVARAISYLHSAASMPIYHRDIKSSNILLDDNLIAKVSDFGASRYIPINQTEVTTAVQGTIGYLDPMYYYTGRLTDKSDVFSFGVLLVELITRRKPFVYHRQDAVGLVSHFVSLLTEGNLSEIIDPQVMEEEDGEVQEVAALAAMCTKLKGEDRPTMREVEMTLENLRVKRHAPCDSTSRRCDRDQIVAHYMLTQGVTKEGSRQYTMEEEILMSATHPR